MLSSFWLAPRRSEFVPYSGRGHFREDIDQVVLYLGKKNGECPIGGCWCFLRRSGNESYSSEGPVLIIGSSMLYLSLLGIPFLGNIILARILYEERKENAVHVLLASGISPIIIWLGKMTITFIIAYLW